MLTILQMGKGYAENRDGFLYVYAPNGSTEGTMNQLVLFRVPKESSATAPPTSTLLDRSRAVRLSGRDESKTVGRCTRFHRAG